MTEYRFENIRGRTIRHGPDGERAFAVDWQDYTVAASGGLCSTYSPASFTYDSRCTLCRCGYCHTRARHERAIAHTANNQRIREAMRAKKARTA